MPAESIELLHSIFTAYQERRWYNARSRNDQIVAALSELAACGDTTAILSIQGLVFDASDRVAFAASRAVYGLLQRADVNIYLDLEAARGTWREWATESWWSLNPSDVERLTKLGASSTAALGLASQHPNGFVRQRAVQELAKRPDELAIPFLLLRVNDWVSAVRADAVAALRQGLSAAHEATIAQHLLLVLRLLECGRAQHGKLVLALIRPLLEVRNSGLLERTLKAADRRSQREIYRIAWQLSGEHQSRLLAPALVSTDPVIRLNATRQLSKMPAAEHERAIEGCLNDTSMPVRRVALLTVVADRPDRSRETWLHALFDAHRSIREIARFYLTKLGVTNFAELYRAKLRAGGNDAICLLGLRESGTFEDVELIRGYLNSMLPKVRRTAVEALAAIDGESFVRDGAIAALHDSSPRVAAAARNALVEHAHAVGGEALFKIIVESEQVRTARMGLFVVDALGKWRALPLLVRLSAFGRPEVAEHARHNAARWFSAPRVNRVFTSPSANEKAALVQAVTDTLHQQPSDFAQSLRAWLRPWIDVA